MATTQAQINQLNALQRLNAPMPKFFSIVRTVGICIAIAGLLVSSVGTSVGIPVQIVALIGDKSVWISGVIASIIAQFTVDSDRLSEAVTELDELDLSSKKK